MAPDRGGQYLRAVNAAARRAGLRPGQPLADARAILPGLLARDADPAADARALEALALWCRRWSPRTAVDGEDAILVDLTGAAHLFGSEAGALADAATRLAGLGLAARLAVAGGSLAAWAWARFGRGGVLATAEATEALAGLPVEALRLAPGTAASLRRLGLGRVGQLAALPRAALRARFGEELARRLDRLAGAPEPPVDPVPEPARFAARRAFAEPLGHTEDIEAAACRLLRELCRDLERGQAGARRLRLDLRRADGGAARVEVGTSRPARDPAHLFGLLRPRFDGLEVGFGVELVRLEARETVPLGAEPMSLVDGAADAAELARLIDRLASRLGMARVVRLQPVASHWPERAQASLPASTPLAPRPWLATRPRPLRLLAQPRPIAAVAPVPDGPPVRVAAGGTAHRVVAAAGPERLLPEWWREEGSGATRPRDYHRVTLADGRTFWVYREGHYGEPEPPRWWVQGRFA